MTNSAFDEARSHPVEDWLAYRDAMLALPATRRTKQIREGAPARHLFGAAKSLGVEAETVAQLIGLSELPTGLHASRNDTLDLASSEALARIGVIQKLAEETFGTAELATEWLAEPNLSLARATPLSQLSTDSGAHEVSRLLAAIRFGGVA